MRLEKLLKDLERFKEVYEVNKLTLNDDMMQNNFVLYARLFKENEKIADKIKETEKLIKQILEEKNEVSMWPDPQKH